MSPALLGGTGGVFMFRRARFFGNALTWSASLTVWHSGQVILTFAILEAEFLGIDIEMHFSQMVCPQWIRILGTWFSHS